MFVLLFLLLLLLLSLFLVLLVLRFSRVCCFLCCFLCCFRRRRRRPSLPHLCRCRLVVVVVASAAAAAAAAAAPAAHVATPSADDPQSGAAKGGLGALPQRRIILILLIRIIPVAARPGRKDHNDPDIVGTARTFGWSETVTSGPTAAGPPSAPSMSVGPHPSRGMGYPSRGMGYPSRGRGVD